MTKSFDWDFLRPLSRKIVATWAQHDAAFKTPVADSLLPPEARESAWLGCAPATEAALVKAEKRIGRSLPPSYRAFLRVTNGWQPCGPLGVPHGFCAIDPIEQVGWFRDRDRGGRIAHVRKLMESGAYDDAFAPEPAHLADALLIGESDGNECILLNPQNETEGEWEVITYDPEGGFESSRSFYEFLRSREYEIPSTSWV